MMDHADISPVALAQDNGEAALNLALDVATRASNTGLRRVQQLRDRSFTAIHCHLIANITLRSLRMDFTLRVPGIFRKRRLMRSSRRVTEYDRHSLTPPEVLSLESALRRFAAGRGTRRRPSKLL